MDRIKFIVLVLAVLLAQAQADMNITQPVLLSGSVGSSGQVFTSQGSGAVPIWTTPSAGSGSPGGVNGEFQYNLSGTFGGVTPTTYNGLAVTQKGGTSFFIVDPTTVSKRMIFDLSNITTSSTRTFNIPDVNSTAAQPKAKVTNQFLDSVSAQGLFTSSQVDFTNLSGTATDAQTPDVLTVTRASNLTSNGFVTTSSSNGTLGVNTSTFLTGNQTITLTGAVTGSGATSIATSYGSAVPTANGGLPTGGTAGQVLTKNSSTNYDASWASETLVKKNSSLSTQTGFASDQYVTGSSIVLPAGAWAAGGQYKCSFDISKTGAGTASIVLTVRVGTAGTISDTQRIQFTWGPGTANADQGHMDVYVIWRAVGSGTSAGLVGHVNLFHNLTTTGLASSLWIGAPAASSGFDSTIPTTLGVSLNGGSLFSGTISSVMTQYMQ